MGWDRETTVTWTADTATTDFQEISGVAGLRGDYLNIENWTGGEYLGILEVRRFGEADVSRLAWLLGFSAVYFHHFYLVQER